jgi:hypothetical protein
MMFFRFPKIAQFNNAIMSVKRRASFMGTDETGEPIYSSAFLAPTVRYAGNVKLHGTNACVSMEIGTDKIHCQSKNRIISVGSDNNGFAAFISELPDNLIKELAYELLQKLNVTIVNGYQINIFGEWSGPGIQDRVAISKADKRFFCVFAISISSKLSDVDNIYFVNEDIPSFRDYSSSLADNNIYLITDISDTYIVEVDFNYPKIAQKQIVELTQMVEDACPVGKFFGVDGIGEGIVWTPISKNNEYDSSTWFKTKGKLHSVSNVKTLADVDLEKVNSIGDFANMYVTENRLKQGIEYLKEMNIDISKNSTGHFIKWIVNDILSEESDTLKESGLTPKDVGSAIGTSSRIWFFRYIEDII